MNVLNNSSDDVVECPLCMEPLEVDDLNFFPCTCGYQICRFCWHRIRTDENELCPACRKAYPENPADFTPLSQEQISALKAEKRQRDQQRKQKITENRKHLANVRVVQKNLVFVVGLPPRLADADILKKYEYFGKYGKIHKVVINPSTTYAGVQGPSASAYVTYVHNNDALRAIQSVNNIMIDGRLIKTSLGTTKYCSHFMKNQQCPKTDCMYLHELGDPEASFTKEEMHQGKHQEYEKRLHDALIASTAAQAAIPTPPTSITPNGTVVVGNNGNNNNNAHSNGTNVQSKEAWPSLSVSPVNSNGKDQQIPNKNNKNSGGNNKENNKKHDKTKADKKSQKNQKSNSNHNNNNNKDGKDHGGLKDNSNSTLNEQTTISNGKEHKHDKNHKEHLINNKNHIGSLEDEINLIEQDRLSDENHNVGRSLSSSSSTSSGSSSVSSTSVSSSSTNGDISGSLSDSTSGKSSPGSFPEHPSTQQQISTADTRLENGKKPLDTQINGITTDSKQQQKTNDTNNFIDTSVCLSKLSLFDDNNSFFSSSSFQPLLKGKLDNESRTLMNNQLNSAISSHLPDLLTGIDAYQNQGNSLNPNASLLGNLGTNQIDNPEKYLLLNGTEDWEAAFKYVLMRNNKQMEEQQQQQQQQQHQQHTHQHQHQDELLRMQEMQKRNNLLNSIAMPQLNGLHDFTNNDFGGSDLNRITQQTAAMFHQQQQQQQQQRQPNNLHHNEHLLNNSLFGSTNMSKFFDFHKSQQQQQQHQYMMNGLNNGVGNDHRDHLNMATLLESNRINSQYLDHANGLLGQQLQKQRLINKFDQMGGHNSNNHSLLLNNPNNTNQQQQQPLNRIPNQFTPLAAPVDDDLGFDPFVETQKALAELMENEIQPTNPTINNGHNNNNKHMLDSCQRPRMPPPGFNHMNAFGFGVPRAQGSKILPFMNMSNGNTNNTSGGPGTTNGTNVPPPNLQQQQQPQQQTPNNWGQHLGFQQNSQLNEQQLQHLAGNLQNQNGGGSNNPNKSAYGNVPDWTAIDPAILSFRQFPYSSHQQQQQQQSQQPQQQHNTDMFMQHLTQQNLQQSGQGFGHHGMNLPNNLLNQQPNSQAPVNFSSHSNWLNNDQSSFMNSLSNGYTNNYDKYSIPMPPGIHSNNMNCMSGNKQQKTECIN